MNFFSKLAFVAAVIILSPGCASIVSKSNWPFSVDTTPSGAAVSITNKKGVEVYRGRTPAAMKLKSGAGFFSKESYTVLLTMKGYETKKINVECKLNGWYFGNLFIGGILGMLIIDPATGAMYRLDNPGLSEIMYKSTTTTSLKVVDKHSIPESWNNHLVKLSGDKETALTQADNNR